MFALPPKSAALLSLPATFMSGFGFMYYYGVQISAMGKSGLLNPKFGWELPARSTPVVALVVGSAIGYVLCVIQYLYPDTQDQIYALSILGATATFLSIFVSFVMFRNYFPTIKREFVSPLGTAGAVYGFVVFLLCFISICGFQKDQIAIIVFSVILAVSSVYYYFVVRKRQVFSEEEKTVMFKAYLMKSKCSLVLPSLTIFTY
jgi:ethanolamine permease